MGSNNRDLKAYVRYDGSGRVVAGSLILRRNKPKVGNWQQVQGYECNSGGTSYQVVATASGALSSVITYRSGVDNSTQTVNLVGTNLLVATICAVTGSISAANAVGTTTVITAGAGCTCSSFDPEVSFSNTTTTTTSSTSTTTTTSTSTSTTTTTTTVAPTTTTTTTTPG
jgi:hypothetical protein